jgi:glycosyltransferase involved in cell wall biosynthesis
MVDRKFALGEAARVAFLLPENYWTGGKNYLRNLFAAIRVLPRKPIDPVIFVGKRQAGISNEFPGITVVAKSMLDRNSAAWFVRKITERIASQDLLLKRTLQQHGISVLSHSLPLGSQSEVKTIGWIPDFQHLHLPEFFSPEERAHRDREFSVICAGCDKVIVSSACARIDLQTFSPEHAHKAELLRFVATPIPAAGASSLASLKKLYSFDGPYFLLPNQFWAHKNHRVVISALRLLKKSGRSFLVLATGSQVDYRNPSFFPTLMRYAADCDVLDCFRVLGQIPFEHLSGLMSHAVAFINPSKFEGWSTTVEEAKSMGKQIVLSNIAVHQEQAPARSFYFPAEEPEALAEALVSAYSSFDRRVDAAMQQGAKACFAVRQREFGEAYGRIVGLVSEGVLD